MVQQRPTQGDAGFTLTELGVIVVIVGVLAAIATPGLLGFLNLQRLRVAQSRLTQVIREAQERAILEQRSVQVSLRWGSGNPTQWAIHPRHEQCIPSSGVNWQKFPGDFDLSTSRLGSGARCDTNSGRISFDYKGFTNALSTIILTSPNNSNVKRCVIMSTLLGAMREESNEDCDPQQG